MSSKKIKIQIYATFLKKTINSFIRKELIKVTFYLPIELTLKSKNKNITIRLIEKK